MKLFTKLKAGLGSAGKQQDGVLTALESLANEVKRMRGEMATKEDVQAVKEDVQAVKEDVQAVKGDVQAVKEDVQAVKGDVQAVKGDVLAVNKRVAVLSTAFPESIAASSPRCVLPPCQPCPSQYGDTATWSLLRHNGSLFAVGCAHCAFSFSTLSGPTVVNIPPCLISHVQALLVRPGYLSAFAPGSSLACAGLPTQFDFVAFELNSAFVAGELSPVEWPSSVDVGTHGVVAGVAHSGDVTGDRLYWVVGKDGEKHIGFVERRGEPGNSGTLMFTVDSSHQLHVLGVYTGIEPHVQGMSFRGRICPLPPFSTLKRYDVRRPEDGETFDVHSSSPQHLTAKNDYIVDCDGAKCPIVVVCAGQEKLPQYCGTADCGYCRSIIL